MAPAGGFSPVTEFSPPAALVSSPPGYARAAIRPIGPAGPPTLTPYPEVSVSMARHRVGGAVTTAVGDAAGAAVDPRQGLQRAKAKLRAPAFVAAAVLLAAGFLLGRRSRR